MSFSFPPGVSEADKETIRTGIALAETYMDQIGGRVVGRISLRVFVDGPCPGNGWGYGSDYNICISVVSTANGEWAAAEHWNRIRLIVHEYFHNLQTEAGCRFEPVWLAEGAADMFANWIITDQGLIDYASLRSRAVGGARDSDPPLPALQDTSHETRGQRYALWDVGAEYLLGGYNLMPYRQFCEAVGSGQMWQEAFSAAFDVTIDEFYRRFAEYRASIGL